MYHIQNNDVFIGTITAENHKTLPVGNYIISWHEDKRCYYLKGSPEFKLPKKIYGDPTSFAKRILNTYNTKESNLGVILQGLKGTGKTLTTTLLAHLSGLPTISLIDPFHGTDFLTFISGIREKCVFIIDEFEKVYPREEQKHLLTLLDGVIQGNKLFVLTANENRIHDALLNRPGRIHYTRTYTGLKEDVIEDVIEDLLHDKTQKSELIEITSLIGDINLDSLITLIREMNMYKETPREALKYLNVFPEGTTMYETKIIFPDTMVHEDNICGGMYEGVIRNPLNGVGIEGYITKTLELTKPPIQPTPKIPSKITEVAAKSDIDWLEPRKTSSTSEKSFYQDIFISKDDLKVKPLTSSTIQITVIKEGHEYFGLEFLLKKKSITTFLF